VRQLDRQISALFYDRSARSKKKVFAVSMPEDRTTPEEEIRDPLVLEFLGLRDEYSEADLEEALILHLEHFLLELGNDFAFVARQKRLRVGDEWYRVDLLFFHRQLRSLILIDLKLGKFTHADAGQMNLYLNYAREHWTHPDENPPIGPILCSEKNAAVAHYALGNLGNSVLARGYKLTLPDESSLSQLLLRMYVSNSATPSAIFAAAAECAWIKLKSMIRLASRSSASSVLPCQSKCFALSSRFETSAPVWGRSSFNALVCCCRTVNRIVMWNQSVRCSLNG
jgi:predicted nuclease of restriction endonuclease-like (RecB) superfamily